MVLLIMRDLCRISVDYASMHDNRIVFPVFFKHILLVHMHLLHNAYIFSFLTGEITFK